MSKRTRPRNLQALERRRRRHARRAAAGVDRAFMRRLWEQTFGPPDPDLEKVAAAIRRRLETPVGSLFYDADLGSSFAELTTFPGPWSPGREFEGGKMQWRATSPTTVEVRVTPAPIAPHIEMSIGFTDPPESA